MKRLVVRRQGEKPSLVSAVRLKRVAVTLLLSAAWLAEARVDAAPTQEESQSVMVDVPAGDFTMGTPDGDPDEGPVRRVRLGAYQIDRLEVSQKAYVRCVQAGVCPEARAYEGLSAPMLPAVGVTWDNARQYCDWVGSRLPTEAEWERAARGADDRRFPWGKALSCSRANIGNFDGAGLCARQNPGRVRPVGAYSEGASPVGALDMSGNAWEWVSDWYGSYAVAGTRNPRGPARGRHRVLRGGSCCSYFAMPTVTNRHRLDPDFEDRDIGFRCARSTTAETKEQVLRRDP